MTIKHHLTDDLLMAYSAGALPEAFNLIVATHISLCDECRARMESHDAIGGSLLGNLEGESLTEGCLASVLDKIRGGEDQAPPAGDRAIQTHPVLPGPLASYVGGNLDGLKWKPLGLGVKQVVLDTSDKATARLLYIPAGTAIPDHGHKGTELTLVLKGAFRDEDGYFARGDIEIANEHTDHTPVADVSEDCICLAVTDAPLKFKGLIQRIAQPFLKI